MVDFVLVGGLLTLFFLAIIQLTLVLHVRNTLIDAAASGARYGTLADRGAGDATERTAQLIGVALNPEFATDVTTGEDHLRRASGPWRSRSARRCPSSA